MLLLGRRALLTSLLATHAKPRRVDNGESLVRGHPCVDPAFTERITERLDKYAAMEYVAENALKFYEDLSVMQIDRGTVRRCTNVYALATGLHPEYKQVADEMLNDGQYVVGFTECLDA